MITLNNIGFSYTGHTLFEGVTLSIARRDFLAVVGSNGSGKTTLMKIILGLLKPQCGQVTFQLDGVGVPSLSMGYLPQYSQIDRLFPVTVRDVVKMGLLCNDNLWNPFTSKQQDIAIDNAMQRMGLTDMAHSPIGVLSGGELQRTMLARAIVSRPHVIILDEPDTYLDNTSENRMYSLLKELNNECAIVLVTHDVDNALQYVKSVYSLDDKSYVRV